MFIYSSLLQEDLQESRSLIGRVKVNALSDPCALVDLTTSRLEGEFPFIGCRTMAETWINEKLQGDSRSWTSSSAIRSRLVECFLATVWWGCYVSGMVNNHEATLNCTSFQNLAKDSTLGKYSFNLSLEVATSYWDRIGFDYFPIQTPLNWKEWFALVSWWHGPR